MQRVLKPGERLFSAVCATEVIVVKSPSRVVELTIGGRPALDRPSEQRRVDQVDVLGRGGALVGKRYVDSEGTIELLCTRAGGGALAVDGEPLAVKESRPLPASD